MQKVYNSPNIDNFLHKVIVLVSSLFLLNMLYVECFASTKATINIPGDYKKIQAGIDAAKDGQIILVAPGTYTENIDFKGKTITLKSSEGAEKTIIDGDNNGAVVTFKSDEGNGAILDGFTITNGAGAKSAKNKKDAEKKTRGGGIFCSQSSSPQIKNNIIKMNTASYGGGICCVKEAAPWIINNVIENNQAGKGGGIYCVMKSKPVMRGNVISGNEALKSGGGIYLKLDSAFLIEKNTIINNNAGQSGGGFFIVSGIKVPEKQKEVHIKECIIRGNEAAIGQAIDIDKRFESNVILEGCNVEGSKIGINVGNEVLVWGEGNIDTE